MDEILITTFLLGFATAIAAFVYRHSELMEPLRNVLAIKAARADGCELPPAPEAEQEDGSAAVEPLLGFLGLVDRFTPDRWARGHDCDLCMSGKLSLAFTFILGGPLIIKSLGWLSLPAFPLVWMAAYGLAVLVFAALPR